MYPIGILLTAQGTGAGKTFIDMYNGNNVASGTYGGLALPVVRIGNLSSSSLPAVGGQTPVGWGIYTNNGYFSGTIAADKGVIGGFSIDSNSIHSGSFGTANSVLVSTGTTSNANIANSGSINGWAFTAGTTYGVTKTGVLYATNAHISGAITVGSGSNVYTKTETDNYLSITTLTSDAKEFRNVASYSSSLNPGTGYITIVTPITPNRMCSIHITGYNYSGKDETIDLTVSFYNYTSGIVNHGFVNKGSYAIKEVRIGQVSSSDQRAVIILGTSANKW